MSARDANVPLEATRRSKPFYAKLHNQVIVAIVAAIIVGAAWPSVAVTLKPLGDGFIKLLSMMITPIVFCIIVSGIAGMGNAGRVARTALRSLVYFYVVSALALLLGLIAANLIPAGAGLNADPKAIDTSSISGYVTAAKDQGVISFLLNIIPNTMVDAFAKGAILQVMLVAVLFGLALIVLGERASMVSNLVDQLTKVVFSIVEMIVALSPIGAFGAMAFTVGRFGLFFFSSRRRHTRSDRDWSSDVCSSDLTCSTSTAKVGMPTATTPTWSAAAGRFQIFGCFAAIQSPNGFAGSSESRAAGTSEIGRASCRERGVDLGGRRIIKKKRHRAIE